MSEFVDHVAKAIYEASWVDPHCAPNPPWEVAKNDPRYGSYAQAIAAIDATRTALKASEFKRGPDGGHGERPTPSLDEIFHVAMGGKL